MGLVKFLKFYFALKNLLKDNFWGGSEVPSAVILKLMSALLLLKNAPLFPELPFYFPEVPFCFLEVRFHFSKMSNYCFVELPFSIPKVTSILDNLIKTSTWSMIFYEFYSNFSLHDSLENSVS